MIVLSLFDGIACGRVTLERAGVLVTKYYASEIDKYAIKVAQKNYPDIVQLGDVNEFDHGLWLDERCTKYDICHSRIELPDNYTAGISNTQRYKALGNGWTVDVLAHIFKGVMR